MASKQARWIVVISKELFGAIIPQYIMKVYSYKKPPKMTIHYDNARNYRSARSAKAVSKIYGGTIIQVSF